MAASMAARVVGAPGDGYWIVAVSRIRLSR